MHIELLLKHEKGLKREWLTRKLRFTVLVDCTGEEGPV
jgi:hypothetical protein